MAISGENWSQFGMLADTYLPFTQLLN
uniref:Uncharacterized protein n=1 Tax=Anguilla anguilla TaxID=7936 RepID=A0A0E9S102_ANGAN